VVRLPGLDGHAHSKDVSDWLDADPARDAGALTEISFEAPLWEPKAPPRLAQSSAEFVAGFVPPDYLIEGLLQRRFIYSLTAATGTGKTAIALLLAALVSRGANLGKLEVAKGRVLYFAGENPDDVRMRWLASLSNSA